MATVSTKRIIPLDSSENKTRKLLVKNKHKLEKSQTSREEKTKRKKKQTLWRIAASYNIHKINDKYSHNDIALNI
ncbi:Hypothetical predicted protein [Octopus vulgaris]|uniref:Uncharacterized protein n=1 Tax=Octopus vulgaris TaxID=6645 RepID=A0AA36F0P3_OCTVU|nr:Hypothetical predicted protein [Octopus vulgaris]